MTNQQTLQDQINRNVDTPITVNSGSEVADNVQPLENELADVHQIDGRYSLDLTSSRAMKEIIVDLEPQTSNRPLNEEEEGTPTSSRPLNEE